MTNFKLVQLSIMKYLLLFFISFGCLVCSTTKAMAQKSPKIKTEEFQVNGVCNMCKKRIEQAALIKGVKLAEWDKETQMLKIMYTPKKVAIDTVLQAVANAGHDTPSIKARDKVYTNLPDCCKYRNGVKVH